MKVLTTNKIPIDRPAASVWQTIIDVENWPKWTPTMSTVVRLGDGLFGLGSEARIKQPAQAETIWHVTEFDDGRRFAWDANVKGIPMRAGHLIRETSQGSESVMTVHVAGPVAILLWPFLKLSIGKAIAVENRGLKEWCERHGA